MRKNISHICVLRQGVKQAMWNCFCFDEEAFLKVEALEILLFLVFKKFGGNSLPVQWLGFRAFTAEGAGSIPGRGTKIPEAAQHGQKKNFFCFVLSLNLPLF